MVPMPFMYIKLVMILLRAFKFCGSFQLATTLVSGSKTRKKKQQKKKRLLKLEYANKKMTCTYR